MNLTPELKARIDAKTVRELLKGVRFGPIGDTMFQGESGEYWSTRLNILRSQDPDEYSRASKELGWGKP